MTIEGKPTLLLVDPATLTTSLGEAAAWTCAETSDEAQAQTRFGRALATPLPSTLTKSGMLRDAGLVHGAGEGSFITGDLCPSTKPLSRAFLKSLEQTGPHVPISLSVSGLWLAHHADDFHWLQEEQRAGALDITWVDHSYTHPFDPGRPMNQDFLLRPGIDMADEIVKTERLLIAQGEAPSVFFRFPASSRIRACWSGFARST